MKRLTNKQHEIIANLSPKCEDCKHYRENKGVMMCHFMSPFLAYTEYQRVHPAAGTMNCGTEGRNFTHNDKPQGRGALAASRWRRVLAVFVLE